MKYLSAGMFWRRREGKKVVASTIVKVSLMKVSNEKSCLHSTLLRELVTFFCNKYLNFAYFFL